MLPTPFAAVNVIGYVPPVPAPGVPLSTPVAGTKVTPEGSAPVSDKVGAGVPVAVTVNVPAAPTVNVALEALVMAGAAVARDTVSVKLCVAFVPTPFAAVIVIGYVPLVPAAGVPARIPVAGVKVTPDGNVPVILIVGTGVPVAVAVKVPAVPIANVALFTLVIAGA